jgi:uncharacterized membrane protein YcaP (DUF421 family)
MCAAQRLAKIMNISSLMSMRESNQSRVQDLRNVEVAMVEGEGSVGIDEKEV